MAFKLPWSNFHELNLDWILDKIKELEATLAGISGSADPSNDPPEMDGTADPGSSANYSRGNHVHPTDTSRASQTYAQSIEGKVDDLDHNCEINFREIYDILNFSTAAPLVDGVANPGNSQYPARADHVHPTDTSRASAVDLAYLTARVDALSGAADPETNDPLMDGAATPGTSTSYARGDHRHPTDTSRASVTALNTLSQAVALKSNILAVDTLNFGDIQTSATTYRASINAYKAGYTFLGFLGYKISGESASTCHVYEMTYTNNNEAQLVIAQSGSLTLNIHITAQALYVANS